MENLESKIDFIRELVRFGESSLGLDFGESFRHFAPDRPSPHWLYVSSGWNIGSIVRDEYGEPFIKAIPFVKALENREKIEALSVIQKSFGILGFDTYLYVAEAWGGAPCPILPILLEQPRIRQAYVVLHEGLHITRWTRKAKPPYEIEEPAAIAIADSGILEFAERTGDKSLFRDLLLLRVFRKKFEQAVKKATLVLEEKYKEIIERPEEEKRLEREKLFSVIRADPIWQDAEEACVTVKGLNRTQEINNAFFLRYGTYYTHLSLIEAAVKRFPAVREAVDFFISLPQELDDALEQLRHKAEMN